MQSFRARLTAASQEEPRRTPSGTRWDPILEEFCDWLNKRYGAFLRASLNEAWGEVATPRVRTLRLWPKGRRNAQTTVLAVQTTEKVARILEAEASPELTEAEDLQSFLVALLGSSAFREKIEVMKERASQPVAGELRVHPDRNARTVADVVVEVPPDQQARLAEASETTPSPHLDGLRVVPSTAPLWGAPYARETKPRWLVAGGYALRLDPGADVLEADGRIRLGGTPVPVDEL